MDIERWKSFSKRDQFLNIVSELERARVWQEADRAKFTASLERALALLDMCFYDEKWKGWLSPLLALREEMAKYYTGESKGSIKTLSNAL